MMNVQSRVGKIAILVPTFNGGALLSETVASVAAAGLPLDSYEVIVSDNASDDGSVEQLPRTDTQGASITIHRNASNLGRVENWNRALQAAERLGFTYAMFLMVGDVLKGTNILRLRDRMALTRAALGIACYEVVDEHVRPLYLARRIRWHGNPSVSPGRFLSQSLARGAMLCAPLGANLYRIDGPEKLRFDVEDASHTDQMATASFACRAGSIVYLDRPVSRWRRRAARFHSSITPRERLANDLRVIERACREASIAPDYPKIRATLILRAMFYAKGNMFAGWKAARGAAGNGIVSWPWFTLLALRWLRNRTPWVIEA